MALVLALRAIPPGFLVVTTHTKLSCGAPSHTALTEVLRANYRSVSRWTRLSLGPAHRLAPFRSLLQESRCGNSGEGWACPGVSRSSRVSRRSLRSPGPARCWRIRLAGSAAATTTRGLTTRRARRPCSRPSATSRVSPASRRRPKRRPTPATRVLARPCGTRRRTRAGQSRVLRQPRTNRRSRPWLLPLLQRPPAQRGGRLGGRHHGHKPDHGRRRHAAQAAGGGSGRRLRPDRQRLVLVQPRRLASDLAKGVRVGAGRCRPPHA